MQHILSSKIGEKTESGVGGARYGCVTKGERPFSACMLRYYAQKQSRTMLCAFGVAEDVHAPCAGFLMARMDCSGL